VNVVGLPGNCTWKESSCPNGTRARSISSPRRRNATGLRLENRWQTAQRCSYSEHRLQLAAYAKSWSELGHGVIRTANCYISTKEEGKFASLKTRRGKRTGQPLKQ